MSERPLRPEANAADGALARRLIGEAATAALAVVDAADMPYGAMTAPAQAADGAILILASDLAAHGQALARDGRASLLFQEAADPARPLTAARLAVQGVAGPAAPGDRDAFLARRPEAARFIDFGDMRLYRMPVRSAHLVAGFGRAVEIPPEMLQPLVDAHG